MWSVPPPEDTGACDRRAAVDEQQLSVLFIGKTPFDEGIGVRRQGLYFSFGRTEIFVDAWTAKLDTPLFTVEAYDTTHCIAFLDAASLFDAEDFAHLITSIVSVDASRDVRQFAADLRVPVFETQEGFYWALHDAVTT